ncbi:uncharacterized protein [Periplaneta americana]|uniref:uncharacterized protein n=1 Tax=Periplaneta americana TaxID=6978 RepID=UPI0037E7B039
MDMTSLSHENLADRQKLLPQLSELVGRAGRMTYLPGVENPLLQIHDHVRKPWRYMTLRKGSPALEVPRDSRASLVINLDSAPYRDRARLLRRHDVIIVKTYDELVHDRGSVLAIYTSVYPFWFTDDEGPQVDSQRMQREWAQGATLFSGADILLYSVQSPVLSIKTTTHTEDLFLHSTNSNRSEFGTLFVQAPANDLNVGHLEFRYYRYGREWWELGEVLVMGRPKSLARLVRSMSSSRVWGPTGLSYHCSDHTIFADGEKGVQIVFRTIQTQPFLDELTFGDSVDCVPFFPLSSLLFLGVASLYIGILLLTLRFTAAIQCHHAFEVPGRHLVVHKDTYFNTQ